MINAQDGNTKKETFDDNKWDWNEIAEKKKSVSIQDGYLVLQCKKDEISVVTATRFPLQIRDNFKITYTFLIPALDDKNQFGIIFNWQDEDNYSAVLLKENYYCFVNRENESSYVDKKGKIILKKGKNKTVTVVMEKIGSKLIFSVDGMQIYEKTMALKHPYFGFYSENKSTIKIDEIVIHQIMEDE
jgi:hypothetical protein